MKTQGAPSPPTLLGTAGGPGSLLGWLRSTVPDRSPPRGRGLMAVGSFRSVDEQEHGEGEPSPFLCGWRGVT